MDPLETTIVALGTPADIAELADTLTTRERTIDALPDGRCTLTWSTSFAHLDTFRQLPVRLRAAFPTLTLFTTCTDGYYPARTWVTTPQTGPTELRTINSNDCAHALVPATGENITALATGVLDQQVDAATRAGSLHSAPTILIGPTPDQTFDPDRWTVIDHLPDWTHIADTPRTRWELLVHADQPPVHFLWTENEVDLHDWRATLTHATHAWDPTRRTRLIRAILLRWFYDRYRLHDHLLAPFTRAADLVAASPDPLATMDLLATLGPLHHTQIEETITASLAALA